MMELSLMVGFCRHIPDVQTFITPVFLHSDGTYVTQYDKEGIGLVTAFRPIATNVGFERTSLDLGTKCGNCVLYGFELFDSVVIGHAPVLAQYLQKKLKPLKDYQARFPRTMDAVKRFIRFANNLKNTPSDGYLFELGSVRRAAGYVPIGMITSEWSTAALGCDHITETQWRHSILNTLEGYHDDLVAHKLAKSSLERLAHNTLDPPLALANLGRALASILRHSHISHGQLKTRDGKILCSTCLFDLIVGNPSSAGLLAIVDLAAKLNSVQPRQVSDNTHIYEEALQVAHNHFIRNKGEAESEEAYKHYIILLEKLAGVYTYATNAEDKLLSLGYPVNTFELDGYFEFIQKENVSFDKTLSRAVAHGRAMYN
jgi:hypothetical protein